MAPVSKKCGVQGCPVTSEDSSCLWKRELLMECIRVHGRGFPHVFGASLLYGPLFVYVAHYGSTGARKVY